MGEENEFRATGTWAEAGLTKAPPGTDLLALIHPDAEPHIRRAIEAGITSIQDALSRAHAHYPSCRPANGSCLSRDHKAKAQRLADLRAVLALDRIPTGTAVALHVAGIKVMR